ncbi:MAG: hypothetical protein V1858_03340 [Candidatus Gottesmanbacteria bacterium]
MPSLKSIILDILQFLLIFIAILLLLFFFSLIIRVRFSYGLLFLLWVLTGLGRWIIINQSYTYTLGNLLDTTASLIFLLIPLIYLFGFMKIVKDRIHCINYDKLIRLNIFILIIPIILFLILVFLRNFIDPRSSSW